MTNNNDFFKVFLDLLQGKDNNNSKKIKLDRMQQNALTVKRNSVIAAGAGSGKTQVLAARFAWLILTDQDNETINIDEILTLTFTKKAAAEMYQRIYKTLKLFEQDNSLDQEKRQRARNALNNFANAHIQTLDSYCGKIVRQNASKYGIRPDFTTGSSESKMDIKTKAFKFILQNKDKPGIQKFAQPGKLQDFAENTFATAIEKYTSLATEDNYFQEKLKVQVCEALKAWNYYVLGKTDDDFHPINEKYKTLNDIINSLDEYKSSEDCEYRTLATIETEKKQELLTKTKNEDISRIERNLEYINSCYRLRDFIKEFNSFQSLQENDITELSDNLKSQIKTIKQFFKEARKIAADFSSGYIDEIRSKISNINKEQYDLYNSLIAFIENYNAFVSLSDLFSQFLKDINSSKRRTGNLSFNDISEMSLKILIENEEVRNQEKKAFKKIMIDEFQDNNGKNRDLLYLISLKNGAFEEKGFPKNFTPDEPIVNQIIKTEGNEKIDYRQPNKLFFVGDEKQSIYKFRGADVSVFNELTQDGNDLVSMTYNYRSTTALIESFNNMFKNGNGIFDNYGGNGKNKKGFEAYYENDAKAKNDETVQLTAENVPIHINLLKNFKDEIVSEKENKTEKELYLSEKEQLAFNIAKKIYEMGNENRNWQEFAILERSRTDAGILTKYLNIFGIPYSIDQFGDIFEEGIINDFYNFFRLCVYPSDTLTYGAYLTSPFCGLSENAVEIILSYIVPYAKESNKAIADIDFDIFPEELKTEINELNQNNYDKLIAGIEFYKQNKKKVLKQRITSTLSYLWNTKGYKYETYLSEKAQLISEHYDMFFELGRQTDESGKNLSWFVDQLAINNNKYSQETADIDVKEISYPMEKGNAVHIMTIHKSKGLEFNNVFIYGCVSVPSRSSQTSVFFDEKTGISIKPDTGEKNYFSLIGEDKYKEEEAAEFRRLIYVAITRAKNSVYIYGNWTPPEQNSNGTNKEYDKNSENGLKLIERMVANSHYQIGQKPIEAPIGEPAFISGKAFDYTVIKPVPYKDLKFDSNGDGEKTVDKQREYALEKTEKIYNEENAEIIKFESIPPFSHISPSSLEKQETGTSAEQEEESELNKKISSLVPDKLQFNDFGTIAHAYEEAQVNDCLDTYEPDIQLVKNLTPSELETLDSICREMCKNFNEGRLGQALDNAKNKGEFYRAEWSFKMFYNNAIFNGFIDLIFSNGDGTYSIVDYKTDKVIVPNNHIEQQKCYRVAAAKLLDTDEKNISLFLYYLRYDKIVPLD